MSTDASATGRLFSSRTAMISSTVSPAITEYSSTCAVIPAGRALVWARMRLMNNAICALVTGSSGP